MIYLLILLLVALAGALFFFLRSAPFGALPRGARLQRIRNAPNYRDGKFQNRQYSPNIAKGYTMAGTLWDFMTHRDPRRVPKQPMPAVRTDLRRLDPDANVLIWFGHSSYFVQLHGKRILVDPVLSGHASPVRGINKAFPTEVEYRVADMPELDYLVLTHDHYDHLDYDTVLALRGQTAQVICSLGSGAHLERWGYAPERITELNWNESASLADGIKVTAVEARHFSGRGLNDRDKTIWVGYVWESGDKKLLFGGDSGYDGHFAEIGAAHGPFDLALLECGQYNLAWHYIHSLPEEVAKAAQELRAKRTMPVHNSKFALALHAWDEPLICISKAAKEQGIALATPKIGEPVSLDDPGQPFEEWWVGLP